MFPQHLLSSHFLTESQQKDVYKKQLVARTAAKEEMIRLFAQEQKLKVSHLQLVFVFGK